MNTLRKVSAFALLALSAADTAEAQAPTATQSVSFSVATITKIAFTASPLALTIDDATVGSAPTSVSDNTSRWALTTNEDTKKVIGRITTAMPDHVSLYITLAVPASNSDSQATGTSAGEIQLAHTGDVDLVNSISRAQYSGQTVTYRLAAGVKAGSVSSTSRTVQLTVTAQ